MARDTVRQALRPQAPLEYERARRASALFAYEPAIEEVSKQFPDRAATVVAERVGWPQGGLATGLGVPTRQGGQAWQRVAFATAALGLPASAGVRTSRHGTDCAQVAGGDRAMCVITA